MIDKLKNIGIKIIENDTDTEIIFEDDSFILLSNDTFFIKGHKEKSSYSIPFCILKKSVIEYQFISSKNTIKLRFKYDGVYYYFQLKMNDNSIVEIKKNNSYILEFNKIFSILDKYCKERILLHSKLNTEHELNIENN